MVKDAIENALRYWLVYNKEYNDNLQKDNEIEDTLLHFDVEKLKVRLSNNETFYNQFLTLIRKNIDQPTTDMINEMMQSLASENFSALKSVAHKMKGTALSACFDKLAEQLKEIEKQEEFNKRKLSEMLNAVVTEIGVLRQILSV